jgi:hypothetical protein
MYGNTDPELFAKVALNWMLRPPARPSSPLIQNELSPETFSREHMST